MLMVLEENCKEAVAAVLFLQRTSALPISGLYGDLHPHLDDPDAKTNSGPDY